MAGQSGGAENLFRYLQGEISFEEWQNSRTSSTQVPECSHLSVGATEEVGTISAGVEGLSVQQDLVDVEITGTSSGSITIKEEPAMATDAGEDDDENDVILIDSETTLKYLSGEMPFEEYQSMLESRIKVEPEEEVATVTVETTEDIPSEERPKSILGKRLKKRGGKRPKLPRHLQGLMGEANMKFARGEHDEAIKMCMEVIRLAPTAPEPFQTMGMLYEEIGDNEKALQFLLIAAHLNPSDSEEWIRLAEMSLESGNARQAISCYDKAIKYDSGNMACLWARCDLLEKLGDKKKAMEGYQTILTLLPKENGEKYMQLSRDMSKNFHAAGDTQKAIATMATAFQEHPSFVTVEDINLLLELYISQSVYDQPIEILIQHCGVVMHYEDDAVWSSERLTKPESTPTLIEIPDEMLIDLRIKLVVCLIHMRYPSACIEPVVAPLFTEEPNEVGDLYLDVAEAYMEVGDYREADPIFSVLVNSDKYNLAAVWLQYGECLNSLGNLSEAADAYGKVVELAPTHMGARVSLSALQQQLGRYDEALHTLEQDKDETEPKLDLRLMLPRCLLLYSQQKWNDFITCTKQVLFGHFKEIFKQTYLSVILGNRSLRHRVTALRNILGTQVEQHIKESATLLTDASFSVDDLWELYIKLCKVLIEQKMFESFQEVSIVALMSPQFMSEPNRAQEADFICLIACLMNRNGHFAYNFIREICVKQVDNNRAWNLFCQIITMSQDLRHNRFCLRLVMKHPNHLPLGLLNGHNALVAGTYKHALGEYVAAFRQDPHNPLISLCIGLTFIHMASQKFASKRHSLTIQGCSFLNMYQELRGECQETYYNLGRAMHQLGLLHAAVFYYRKALTYPPAITGKDKEVFDLSREIAFNLTLIYQNSGSYDLAAMTAQQHLVV